jgi:hypothetical protein
MTGMGSFSALFAQWKQADAVARAAEETILSDSMTSLEGQGTLPTAAQWQEAKRLRAFADKLLDEAIERMRQGDAHRRAGKPPDDASGDQAAA